MAAITSTTSVKASKTWVLPPRPKPGRKSKKDLAAAAAAPVKASKVVDEDDEMDGDVEKATNRTKQKASRERKQEYIAELEAKVRAFEQGDGERASFFQGLAKTYSEQNAALTKENEELRRRLALFESGQVGSGPSASPGPAVSSAQPVLARKASSESFSTRGNVKRQRTKSISSNASSSSNNHYHTTSSISASSSTSLTSAQSNLTSSTSGTAVPPKYFPATSRSPAAMVIPSPTISLSMHASPSPAASTSSYFPPSPPISLGLSPQEQSSYLATRQERRGRASGCGVCESSSGTSCICQDIGLKSSSHRHHEEGDDLDESDFRDLNLLPSSATFPSEFDRCGFCTESTTGACLCAEVGMRGNTPQSTYRSSSKLTTAAERAEEEDMLSPLPSSRPLATRPVISASSGSSTVPNIPPGAASVRLRLPKRGIPAGQIWRIDPNILPSPPTVQQTHTATMKEEQPTATSGGQRHPAAAAGVALRRKLIKVGSRLPCSGDPKTCLACADDPAGQAFCSALSNTVCSGRSCTNCPNRPSPLSNEVSTAIKSASPTRPTSPYAVPASDSFASTSTVSLPSIRRRDSSARDEIPHAMIPCSDAWATLREHPNIGYANLDMLASVVAKRTQCMMDEKTETDGKIVEVDQQGVEEALELLDHMRDVENAKAKIDAI